MCVWAGPTSGPGESGGWLPPDKPFNHRRLHGCHFLFGQVSGSKRNQRKFPMSMHSVPGYLHTEMELMHEMIKRERLREREGRGKHSSACILNACMNACMNGCNLSGAGHKSIHPVQQRRGWRRHLLQKQAIQLDTFPESLRSTSRAFKMGSRYLKGDWPKYLLRPRGSI